MRACARGTPPRAPDVVLVAVLVLGLAAVLEAGNNPCPRAHHNGHDRSRRTTVSGPSPAVGTSKTTGAASATSAGAADKTTESDESAVPFSVTGFADPTAPEAPTIYVTPLPGDAPTAPALKQSTAKSSRQPVTAPTDDPLDLDVTSWMTVSSEESMLEKAGLKVTPSSDVSSRSEDTVVAGTGELPTWVTPSSDAGGREVDTSIEDVRSTPLKRTPLTPHPKTTMTPRIDKVAKVAKLQEERTRRLEKIQRDLLERKHRRVKTTSTAPTYDVDDNDDLSLHSSSDESQQVAVDKRPLTKSKKQDDGAGKPRPAATKHAVAEAPENYTADRTGRKKQRRPTEQHDREDTRAPTSKAGKRARAHQDRDDRDRSVEDNSLSDGSWEDSSEADAHGGLSDEWGGLVCPTTDEVSLFSRQCQSDRDCKSVGEQCCKDRLGIRRCVFGVPPILPDIPHEPFFGVIARVCPSSVETLVEPWSITNCTSDDDCWPRVCCTDGHYAYCRTPQLEWEKLPGQRFVAPLRLLMSYLQCTPPPPPVFDLFPKPCRNTLDCFPNLCCQERGRKVCRPPKRSLLALLASLGQGAGFSYRSAKSRSSP